ncbi:MAG TPA: MFS transporter [Candidatus Limnocylindrales bacterium]|nr:MFS transporter [Candidatus Limnocylindrales bacterium]
MTDPDAQRGDPGTSTSGRPTTTLPLGHLARISLYWLGLTAIDGAVGLFIQNRLKFDHYVPELEIGRTTFLLAIPVAIVGILIQPTVGSISDYTVSRWGRRKPFIVIGSLLDLISLFGIATANDVLALGAFVTLLAFTTNIARGPFQGYVPDLVAERQVGLASALVGLMQILGNVTGFLLITIAVSLHAMPLALAAVAIVELVTMVAVVLRVGNGRPALDRGGRSWPSVAGEVWGTDILRERSYVWLVGSRLFFLMGGAMLVNYVLVYFGQTHALDQDGANGQNFILLILVVIGNLIAVLPASRLSDRIGRKPVIYAACVIGFAGVGLAAIAPVTSIALVGGFLFGASAGMFLAVDWALMTDIIPRAESGRYMGISNLATASSTVFALALGGPIIDFVNIAFGLGAGPRAAYGLGAAFYLIAILLFRPVVEPPRTSRRRDPAPEEAVAAG